MLSRLKNLPAAVSAAFSYCWNSLWLDVLLIISGLCVGCGTYLADYIGGFGLARRLI